MARNRGDWETELDVMTAEYLEELETSPNPELTNGEPTESGHVPTVATGYTEDSVNLLIQKAVDDATDEHRKGTLALSHNYRSS